MVRGTVDGGFRVRGLCGRVSGVGACPPGGSELSGCRVDQGQGLLTGATPRSCQQEEGLTDSTVRQLGHPLFSSLNLPPSNQQRQKDHAQQAYPSQNLAPPGSSTDPPPS